MSHPNHMHHLTLRDGQDIHDAIRATLVQKNLETPLEDRIKELQEHLPEPFVIFANSSTICIINTLINRQWRYEIPQGVYIKKTTKELAKEIQSALKHFSSVYITSAAQFFASRKTFAKSLVGGF
jgi:hypothetical protein